MIQTRTRTAVALLSAGAVLASCANHQSQVQLGLKRITLDLAFKSAAKAPPIQQVLAAPQPMPVVAELTGNLQPVVTSSGALPPFKLQGFTCPKAAPGALPAAPAQVFITAPAQAGVYYVHNEGTFKLDSALLKLAGPYPKRTDQAIANVSSADTKDATGTVNGKKITYDVVERNPLQTITTTYVATTQTGVGATNDLKLVKRETKTSSGTVTFAPVPAITMMQFKGEGASWNSAGIDPANGTVMVVQGAVEKKEIVDVCGTLVDTYRVRSSEHVANVVDKLDYKTDDNDPTIYNVATQLGGLVVRQHVNATTTFTVNNLPFSLNVNVTMTNDSINPLPPGSPSPPLF